MKKQPECKGKKLRVTNIQYVPRADNDERLSRAIDILLRAATRHAVPSDEGTNAKKKEEDVSTSSGDGKSRA